MIDRAKLTQALQQAATVLFANHSHETEYIRKLWSAIGKDPLLHDRLHALQIPLVVPTWKGLLNHVVTIDRSLSDYNILAIDGSQIYPDRHYNPTCFLINIGSILLNYRSTRSYACLHSQPFVFVAQLEGHEGATTDVVNCRRQELEFDHGLHRAFTIGQHNNETPFLMLFDGSLIFWLLESKENTIREHYLNRYIDTLERMYQEKIPIAGYISFPKSRELVNIVRIVSADFSSERIAEYPFTNVLDSTIVSLFLRPYERTTLFQSNASMSSSYPSHLRPHFFYINVGEEIGRVEIPAWVALKSDLIHNISRIIIDQCDKGLGYPIALAEAHETAVIKGSDRDFFYYMLDRMGNQFQKPTSLSQKNKRKKFVNI